MLHYTFRTLQRIRFLWNETARERPPRFYDLMFIILDRFRNSLVTWTDEDAVQRPRQGLHPCSEFSSDLHRMGREIESTRTRVVILARRRILKKRRTHEWWVVEHSGHCLIKLKIGLGQLVHKGICSSGAIKLSTKRRIVFHFSFDLRFNCCRKKVFLFLYRICMCTLCTIKRYAGSLLILLIRHEPS